MPTISIKAVILASLAVFGVDIISQMTLINAFDGPPLDAPDEQVRAAMLILFQDTRFLTLLLVFGIASTVLGGYLAARLARSVPYFNALAFGVLGLLASVMTSNDLPLWSKIVGFGLTLPAALLGGHIAKLQMQNTRS
jgi:Zn-dependent protease with chaperone function